MCVGEIASSICIDDAVNFYLPTVAPHVKISLVRRNYLSGIELFSNILNRD